MLPAAEGLQQQGSVPLSESATSLERDLAAVEQEFAAIEQRQQQLAPAAPAAAAGGDGVEAAADAAGAGLQGRWRAAAAAAAHGGQQQQAAAGSLSVQQLLAHSLPKSSADALRKLLRLVHGTKADAAAVRVADLLLHWPLLLQRVGDNTAPLSQETVKRYTESILRCLKLPCVQEQFSAAALAQLQQQVQAGKAETTRLTAAAAAAAAGGGRSCSQQQQHVGQQQAAAGGLSVAQLLVEAQPLPGRWGTTALRKLLLLVHGPEADAAAVQVADLLPQWPLLQAHLQQRVEGKGEESPLKPNSARDYLYGILHCLELPCVQAQFSAAALLQLHLQVQRGKNQLMAMPDRTAAADHAARDTAQPAGKGAAAASRQGGRHRQLAASVPDAKETGLGPGQHAAAFPAAAAVSGSARHQEGGGLQQLGSLS
jgi:hypothetical protein